MTNFERIGAEWQNTAMNQFQAIKSFRRSCQICCERGYRIDCDRCEINAAHKEKLDVLRFLNEERIAKAHAAEVASVPRSVDPVRPVRITIVV